MSVDPTRSVSHRSAFEVLEGRTFLSASLLGDVAPDVASASPAAEVSPFTSKSVTRSSIKVLTTTSVAGQSVRLTGYVSRKSGVAVNGGVVTFKSGTTVLGTATVVKGQARLFVTNIPVGTTQITSVFNGTKSLATSTSLGVSHTVTKATTTTTVAMSTGTENMGLPVTYTTTTVPAAPGAGVPRGTMQFFEGSTLLGSAAVNKHGHAVFTVENFFLGSHTVTAKYQGAASYNASNSAGAVNTVTESSYTTSSTGLKSKIVVAGSGAASKTGDNMVVNYTGYLTDGTKFDSSLNAGRTPFSFTLGNHEVIDGWEEGMLGMKPGERRVLKIPPALAYGATGQGNVPGNATLYFIVQYLHIGQPQLVVQGGPTHTTTIANNQAPGSSIGTAFGSVAVGVTSATSTFALGNGGAGSLGFTANPAITVTGTNAADFILTQPTFPGDGTAQFTVKFKPKAKGARSAVITIFTNDPNFPQFKFTVTGTGA